MTLGFSSNLARGGAWLSQAKATTGIEPVFPSYRPHAIGMGAAWAHRTAPVDRERVRDAVRSIEWFKAGDDA